MTSTNGSMSPELIVGMSMFFILFGLRGMSGWTRTSRPMIFWKLGRIGDVALAALAIAILLGGLSLIVWGLINAAWWSIPLFFSIAWVAVQLSRASIYTEAFVTSAVGPAIASIGIITLHFFTWI